MNYENSSNLIASIKNHPIDKIIDSLSKYTEIERDDIIFTVFLTVASGRMAMPVHLEIVSDECYLDKMIIDRVFALIEDRVAYIDTYAQYKAEERNGFENRDVIYLRRPNSKIFYDVLSYISKSHDLTDQSPSIIRVVSKLEDCDDSAPMLRLMSKNEGRILTGFASSYASSIGDPAKKKELSDTVSSLCSHLNYPWPNREISIKSSIIRSQTVWLVVERLLQIFANIRRISSGFKCEQKITSADYAAVRAFLMHLPIVPQDRAISTKAIRVGEQIYSEVTKDGYQLAIPDLSDQGHQWFTRNQAVKWTGLSYTSIKKYLYQLEGEGILLTTVAKKNRHHGRVIHYRFSPNRVPPFKWTNPFGYLPELPE